MDQRCRILSTDHQRLTQPFVRIMGRCSVIRSLGDSKLQRPAQVVDICTREHYTQIHHPNPGVSWPNTYLLHIPKTPVVNKHSLLPLHLTILAKSRYALGTAHQDSLALIVSSDQPMSVSLVKAREREGGNREGKDVIVACCLGPRRGSWSCAQASFFCFSQPCLVEGGNMLRWNS